MPSGLIILAEDDTRQRKMYTDALEQEGYLVLAAVDGREALLLLSSNKPKLLLLDVKLGRLDGIEVCRRARPLVGDRTPIIFLTAHDDLDTLHACLAAGGDDYVVKDGQLERLLRRINQWIENPRGLTEVKRQRVLTSVTSALEEDRAEKLRSAEEVLARARREVGLSSESDPIVAHISELVRKAREAAGENFGLTIEQKLALLGYVAGIVDQMGATNLNLKFRFRDYLRAILLETGILLVEEIDQMFSSWDELAGQGAFTAAFEHGRRDSRNNDDGEAGFVPRGLATVMQ